jgi:Trypsin-like peptidase domain
MRRSLFSVLVLVVACSRVEAACIDPSLFVASTMSITRHFNEEEAKAQLGVIGIRGTAWFLSPRLLVTAAHVPEAMHLSAGEWKDIEIKNGEGTRSLSVRILHLAGRNAEKIAVLELRSEIRDAAVLQRRAEPLIADEQVVSLAYPDNQLRFAGGRFVKEGDDNKFAGSALFEMYDGNDRLVLDHGASGAPVLDCDGRVVAVVTTLITQTMNFLSNAIRISTAWQSPNVVAIPIQVLKDFSSH